MSILFFATIYSTPLTLFLSYNITSAVLCEIKSCYIEIQNDFVPDDFFVAITDESKAKVISYKDLMEALKSGETINIINSSSNFDFGDRDEFEYVGDYGPNQESIKGVRYVDEKYLEYKYKVFNGRVIPVSIENKASAQFFFSLFISIICSVVILLLSMAASRREQK